jgi:hypothetical protein
MFEEFCASCASLRQRQSQAFAPVRQSPYRGLTGALARNEWRRFFSASGANRRREGQWISIM